MSLIMCSFLLQNHSLPWVTNPEIVGRDMGGGPLLRQRERQRDRQSTRLGTPGESWFTLPSDFIWNPLGSIRTLWPSAGTPPVALRIFCAGLCLFFLFLKNLPHKMVMTRLTSPQFIQCWQVLFRRECATDRAKKKETRRGKQVLHESENTQQREQWSGLPMWSVKTSGGEKS